MVETVMIIFVPFILLVLSLVILSLIWRPVINRLLDLKDKKIKISKYELYNKVNIEVVNNEIDAYIQIYIDRYILYKFIANKIIYIKQEDTNAMIKDITTNIALDISDLYLYYISLVYSYDTDEELITFIKSKVTNATIEYVTNYNATNIPST